MKSRKNFEYQKQSQKSISRKMKKIFIMRWRIIFKKKVEKRLKTITKFKRKQNDIQITKKNRTKMRKNDKSKLKIKKNDE